ncbi:MAG: mechanosensitive ion channel family protein, partial [Gammaproteobacteria bacterium]|nr:mechanosensitive ion channel family protein [Gammaproteobacteria bacterium]
ELILPKPEPTIGVKELGDSAVMLAVCCWVKKENYGQTHADLLETIKLEFDKQNITLPFPQLDVSIKKG